MLHTNLAILLPLPVMLCLCRGPVQDLEDPSDLVYLRACDVQYANTFTYAKAVRVIPRSNRTIIKWVKRRAAPVRPCTCQCFSCLLSSLPPLKQTVQNPCMHPYALTSLKEQGHAHMFRKLSRCGRDDNCGQP